MNNLDQVLDTQNESHISQAINFIQEIEGKDKPKQAFNKLNLDKVTKNVNDTSSYTGSPS